MGGGKGGSNGAKVVLRCNVKALALPENEWAELAGNLISRPDAKLDVDVDAPGSKKSRAD